MSRQTLFEDRVIGCLRRLGSLRDGRALASGALYDLSHVDAVERHGFASVLGLDLIRGPASRILGLENNCGPALVAILNPDPIASDETGLTRGTISLRR